MEITSMFPYIIWRDVDSRTMGVWVAQYPDRVRAAERVNQITIPGRAGQLILTEGEAVYEPITLTIRLQTFATNDFEQLNNWLRGEGLLIIGREPTKAYQARIIEEVDFIPYSKDIAEASLKLVCEPFKRLYPEELSIILTESGSVLNGGNVPSKPLIKMFVYDSDVELTIGDNTMEITGQDGLVVIDCEAKIVTFHGENIMSATSGNFFTLAPGLNDVSWTGHVITCNIWTNARWL